MLDADAFQLIYIDPPFNTGRQQQRRTLRTEADADGDRTGFAGRRYSTRLLAEPPGDEQSDSGESLALSFF